MSFVYNPVYVLGVLCLLIYLSEILSKKRILKSLGPALIVILLAAIVANLGLIPSASDSIPLYDIIFEYATPLALFYLLLEVNLKSIKEAGIPLLFMFFVGSLGTALGAFVSVSWIIDASVFGEFYNAIAGMFTGTYVGGSINFNAVALHYKVMDDPSLFAGAIAVDNILTTLWMVCCLLIPMALNKILPRDSNLNNADTKDLDIVHEEEEMISSTGLSFLLSIGILVLFISYIITDWLTSVGYNIPFIIVLTSIAIVLAQFQRISYYKGARLMGIFGIYLFLAVIGAFCELSALVNIGALAVSLFVFALVLVVIHGLFLFVIGFFTKYDWQLIAIASQANIGGQTSAIALAKSFNRNDLIVPSVLVGSLGNALGTYLGFLVAGLV